MHQECFAICVFVVLSNIASVCVCVDSFLCFFGKCESTKCEVRSENASQIEGLEAQLQHLAIPQNVRIGVLMCLLQWEGIGLYPNLHEYYSDTSYGFDTS